MFRFAVPLAALTLLLSGAPEAAAQLADAATVREITLLKGNLYGFRAGDQHSAFLVTTDGIVLFDPLDRATAQWLKAELLQRFPDRPVKYVLVSHHGVARAEGASQWFESTELVGNRRFGEELSRARRAAPERYRFGRDVETVFDERTSVMLGGQTVEAIHVGTRRTPEMSLVFVPGERVIFAVDPPPVVDPPLSFDGVVPRELLAWLHTVSPLEADTILLGDGRRMAHADAVALGRYLDTLLAEVAAAYVKGYSLTATQRLATAQAHTGSPHYLSRDAHVAALYRSVFVLRAEASGAAVANWTPRNPAAFCTNQPTCSAGGMVPAGTAGVTALIGRWIGVTAEVTLGQQLWATRAASVYAEDVALRESRGALLFRYSPPHSGRHGYALLGGISRTAGHMKGIELYPNRLLPTGGRHVVDERQTRSGLTFGAEVSRTLQSGLVLSVPVRLTRFSGADPAHWPGGFDVHVGIGLRFPVFKRVS